MLREDEPKENQKKVISKEKCSDSFEENRHVQDLKANQICEIENERRWIGADRPSRSTTSEI